MQSTPEPSLDWAARDLALRLDRLLHELTQVRTACLELSRALKAARARPRPAQQRRARRSGPLEAADLQALVRSLRTEPLDALREKLQSCTVPQLGQLAAAIGSSAARGKPTKGELIERLLADARYHDEHRSLRGF